MMPLLEESDWLAKGERFIITIHQIDDKYFLEYMKYPENKHQEIKERK